MTVALFSNGNNLARLYVFLRQNNCFNTLVVPNNISAHLSLLINDISNAGYKVHTINDAPADWQSLTIDLAKADVDVDVIITMGFPYKIPDAILAIPGYGAFNVHFSLLPAYRGADPVFWQLRNGVRESGVTIHCMSAHMDKGATVIQQQMSAIPGETYGMLHNRLTMVTMQLLQMLLSNIDNISFSDQDDTNASYFPRPAEKDMTIDWATQTADEIECMVNACNPAYGGAITYLNGQQVRIIEVSPADLQGNINAVPGSVAYADANYGLFVTCRNNTFLRLNIVATQDGTLTGAKMAALGISTLHNFEKTN